MTCRLLQRAREFASDAHGDQMYGDQPYVFHLIYVCEVLKRFDFGDPVLHASAWLHDVVEDTEATSRDILTIAGPDVYDIVSRVTDKPGKNRKERKDKTYPRIAESKKATLVKVADRIANVENCILTGESGLFKMYHKEHYRFTSFLHKDRDGLEEMWDHLDRLLSV